VPWAGKHSPFTWLFDASGLTDGNTYRNLFISLQGGYGDFLLRRIGESGPRSLRLAVLLDKTSKRRVALEPDYFGFRSASNQVWSGYGLAEGNGTGRSGKHLMARSPSKNSRKKRVGKK
jgi:hypothetical protein